MCVGVCVCVCASVRQCEGTVFLVCQSSKCLQLLRLHLEQQSYLGQEHIT